MTQEGTDFMKIVGLPIEFEWAGEKNTIFPSLIIANNELTLVDTGYPDFLPLIERAIINNGFQMEQLKHIIITHYDHDHIGALYDFHKKYPSIVIITSELEAKFISGEEKAERLIQAEAMLEKMSKDEKEFGMWFIQQLKDIKPAPVQKKVRDGDWILDSRC